MSPDQAMDVVRETMMTALLISGPILAVGLVVGLAVSIFQAVTQIQEQTLSFIPKLGVLVAALFIFGPWMLSNIVDFTQRLILNIPQLLG